MRGHCRRSVKMVNMFSADHKSSAGMVQRSYDLLNPQVKQARHLTIGFVDQRVLLNNILTAEESLKPLENDFERRHRRGDVSRSSIRAGGVQECHCGDLRQSESD